MGLYQGLFGLFGAGNIAAVASAWLGLALLGAALCWGIAAACEDSPSRGAAGPWAAILFAVSVGTVGGTLNTEVPAAVAAAAAVLVWMRAARRRAAPGRASRALVGAGAIAGVLAGAAFLCRQNGGALWPLLIAGEGILVFEGRRALGEAVRSALAISGGFLATAGAVFGVYALRGTLSDMLFCVYGYNATIYIAATKIDAARLLAAPLTAAKSFLLPVWTTSALGLAGLAIAAGRLRKDAQDRTRRAAADPATGTAAAAVTRTATGTVASKVPSETEEDGAFLLPVVALVAIGLTLSLFPGLRLFSHYFAMPLPFWAVLGGIAVARATNPRMGRLALAVGAIVLVSLGAELAQRPWIATARALRGWVADGGLSHAGDPLVWPGHDPLAAKAARWIRQNSAPDDTVFVWGMHPHVPLYAQRVPATRFVTCTFLTGLVPWERVGSEEDTSRWIVPGSWDLLAHDLDAERPRFIVDASQDHLFAMGAYAPDRFPVLRDRLATSYERVFDTGGEEHLVIWRRRPEGALAEPR